MWQSMIYLLYPFSAFIFIRIAMRCFAAWAAKPHIVKLIFGVLFSSLTIHASWTLFCWTATMPLWWIQWLVFLAFGWIFYKNVTEMWQFNSLRKAANEPQIDTP